MHTVNTAKLKYHTLSTSEYKLQYDVLKNPILKFDNVE